MALRLEEMALSFKGKYKYVFCLFVFLTLTLFTYKSLPDNLLDQNEHQGDKRQLPKSEFSSVPLTLENLPQRLTVLIRDFEDYDNKIIKTVENIEDTIGPVQILIVADNLPYPPLKLNPKGPARIVTLSSNLLNNYSSSCVTNIISTELVLVIPDAVTIPDWKVIKTALSVLKSKNTKAVAIKAGDARLSCSSLHVNLKEWTISYHANDSSIINDCPLVQGNHGLLMHLNTLKSLSEPFSRPFPLSFYIQMRVKGFKTRIAKSQKLNNLVKLYSEPHFNWKRKQAEAERLKSFYKSVGIKRGILSSGISQYFGCSKTSSRCFGTIIDDMAQYLYEGRWTPPCCLKALRETSAHVFSILDKCDVRYWLEGGSLLGAVRNGDIIPWDYDVDLGIYREDIEKCPPLKKLSTVSKFIDSEEFVWEKSNDGDFFHIQYSQSNHLHVDIFPFYSKNGVMTKDTWFPTHRQDTEFPERFLKPLTRIKFAGLEVSAPNNVREFLVYKFGAGVIENPKYPNYQKPVM